MLSMVHLTAVFGLKVGVAAPASAWVDDAGWCELRSREAPSMMPVGAPSMMPVNADTRAAGGRRDLKHSTAVQS